MRNYASVNANFWIGRTGRSLRGNHEAQIVALYLITSPHSNMIGLYHCPIAYIAHETGLSTQGATKGLRCLIDVDFCTFDADIDFVFVHQMAKHQIGDTLQETDKRWKGVHNQLTMTPDGPCKQAFIRQYNEPYNLGLEFDSESPYEAPSKGLPSPKQAPPKPGTGTGTGAGKGPGAGAGAGAGAPAGFDSFWTQYPKKVARKDAIEAFNKINPDEQLLARMLKRLERDKADIQWIKDKGQFIPHPATWLNRRDWEGDDAAQETKAGAQWAINAGFLNEFEARNAGCFERNAHEFRNGERIAEVAA
ncbi:MAG: hypothetical protein N2Z61_00390 [Tepidimonas fonticaldi]|nr:hypothetical protein [Tepidimonas fonticaldi]